MKDDQKGKIIIPAGRKPWPHELRAANTLAEAGYVVEFLPESNIKTADILLNGIKYEIKSPESDRAITIEHILKKALKQSKNIIIDTSRIKKCNNEKIRRLLLRQFKIRKAIKKIIIITKQSKIIYIS